MQAGAVVVPINNFLKPDEVNYITRDAGLMRDTRDLWKPEIDCILARRDKETGLLPPEQYCSDIATPVVSVSTNASAWRALRQC